MRCKLLLIFAILLALFLGGCDLFTKEYTLTIQIEGEGSVTPGEGDHTHEKGTVVDLTATPDEGWIFIDWVGDVVNATSQETTVLVDEDKEITAVFRLALGVIPEYPGQQTSHTVNGVDFNMRFAPASTFPTGIYDSGSATVDHNFWIAETQVTYELWYEVRMWALDNGYTFANAGMEGSTTGGGPWPNYNNIGNPPTSKRNEPVTMVSWYDSIVWCNALSEMLGYDPVYTIDGAVIKSASGIDHRDVVAEDRDGFRLPTSMEWELAARYKGSDSSHGAIEHPADSGNFWTPGNYASGATADSNNAAATQEVAWYWSNSSDGTKDVGLKRENGLRVFDMSGNVWEWCFTQSGSYRVVGGGSWFDTATWMQVRYVYSNFPVYVYNNYGFRFLRTNF